jgi:hypothetical protein
MPNQYLKEGVCCYCYYENNLLQHQYPIGNETYKMVDHVCLINMRKRSKLYANRINCRRR